MRTSAAVAMMVAAVSAPVADKLSNGYVVASDRGYSRSLVVDDPWPVRASGGRYMGPAELDRMAARRRRARQTHPGKRGRR